MAEEPAPARPGDAAAIAALRDACARWQQRSGITQWNPGEVSTEQVAGQIDRRQWWVVRDGGLVAAVRLLAADPQVWPDPGPAKALYIHGLMAARSTAGKGRGRLLLDWAETRAAQDGCAAARLDCVAGNRPLRAYYEHRGYLPRGRRDFGLAVGLHPVMRYEKPLA